MVCTEQLSYYQPGIRAHFFCSFCRFLKFLPNQKHLNPSFLYILEDFYHKMTHQKTMRLLFLLLLLLHPTSQAGVDPEQEVIVESSPCSITCGLGLKRQTLCLLKDSRTALEEGDAEVNTSNSPCSPCNTLLMTLTMLPVGLREVSCPYCQMSGDMVLWTSDHDHDSWTGGGA